MVMSGRRWAILGSATFAIVGAAGCGSATPSGGSTTITSGSGSTSNSSAAATAAAAGAAYVTAFNTMNDAVNADIPAQNKAGTDPTGATTAINDEASARQTFDTAVQAITFPASDQADAQAVLSADASLESVLGTLAANTNDIGNYNSIFDTVTPAQSAFTAADNALSNELGLTSG